MKALLLENIRTGFLKEIWNRPNTIYIIDCTIHMFNLDRFISDRNTCRPDSIFKGDIENNASDLSIEIDSKSVCIICGTGSIGSSFIKSILRFKPGKLVIIDLNENGLLN